MTLGSPVQTPPHLNYGTPGSHGHQPQSGFLPGYLMGDPTSPSSPGLSSHRPMISPTKLQLNRSLSMASSGTPQSPAPMAPQRGPPLLAHNASLNRSHLRTPGEKHGGPPTLSLMGGLTPNRANNSAIGSPFGTPGTPMGGHHTPMPSTPQLSFGATPNICTAREEIAYSSEPTDPMDVWVTVFGFPPSAASFILSQFSACGTVLQHSMPPNANWMHLKFQTRLQAKKAISKNGTVLGSTIMVGVSPCSDSSVLENLNSSVTSPLHDTSINQSVSNINSSLGTPRSIRPLTQAYKDAQGEFKVVPNTNTPNKNSGLVSKAMGCMFGW